MSTYVLNISTFVHMSSGSTDKEIGRRLQQVREAGGLSQQAFADSLGVSLRTYQNYERGERSASKDMICALIEHHNVDPTYLLLGKKVAKARIDLSIYKEIQQALKSEHSIYRGLGAELFGDHTASFYNKFADIEDPDQRKRGVLLALLLTDQAASKQETLYKYLGSSEFANSPSAQAMLQQMREANEEHLKEIQALLDNEQEFQRAIDKIWGSEGSQESGKDSEAVATQAPPVQAETIVTQNIKGSDHEMAGRDIVQKSGKRKKK